MSTLPNVPSNKKCWQLLNRIVLGDSVSCPTCNRPLQENYRNRYCWCSSCRKKYRATAHKGSWLYGMKLSPRQLFILLWCWQQRRSTEATMPKAEVSYPTLERWFSASGIGYQIPGRSSKISSKLTKATSAKLEASRRSSL
jgi:hypothetical protein